MNVKRLLIQFAAVFVTALMVSAAVTLLWNFIAHRAGTVDWETSFRLAITLGILLPWVGMRRGHEK